MRLLKRILIVVAALLALAFILLHVGPDIDTDAETDAQASIESNQQAATRTGTTDRTGGYASPNLAYPYHHAATSPRSSYLRALALAHRGTAC
jgi:hypothetical protein